MPPNTNPMPAAEPCRRVVEDPQDLLVVRVARLAVGELVEVDHLVQADQQPVEPGQPDEPRQQLELVVEVGVVDDGAHAEGGAGVGAGGELAAQPADRVGLQLLVAGVVALPVLGDDLGEVVATGQLASAASSRARMTASGSWPAARASVRALVTNRSTTLPIAPPSGLARVDMFRISSL